MNAHDLPLPPHSVEAEYAVLGGILIGGANAMDRLEGIVGTEDFYREDHRLIFAAAKVVHESGQQIDVITVIGVLEARREAEKVGGVAYLGEISNNTPSARNITRHAEIVHQKAVLRALCAIASDMQAAAAGPGQQEPDEIAQQAEAAMLRLLDRQGGDPTLLGDAVGETLHEIDARRERGGGYAGLLTGFPALDAITGGLEPGQLVILAARPSVGKSALATNIAYHVAAAGTPVLFCTLEMSRREIAMRVLSTVTRIPVAELRAGPKDNEQWRRLTESQRKCRDVPLHIDDRGAITVGYVRAKARRLKRSHALGLIVVDYLHLMD
jgi:replicative DNA helicase